MFVCFASWLQSAAVAFIENIQSSKLSISPEEFQAGFYGEKGQARLEVEPAPASHPRISVDGIVRPIAGHPAPPSTGPPILFPEEDDPPIPYFLNMETSGLRLADVPLLLADYKRLAKRLLNF